MHATMVTRRGGGAGSPRLAIWLAELCATRETSDEEDVPEEDVPEEENDWEGRYRDLPSEREHRRRAPTPEAYRENWRDKPESMNPHCHRPARGSDDICPCGGGDRNEDPAGRQEPPDRDRGSGARLKMIYGRALNMAAAMATSRSRALRLRTWDRAIRTLADQELVEVGPDARKLSPVLSKAGSAGVSAWSASPGEVWDRSEVSRAPLFTDARGRRLTQRAVTEAIEFLNGRVGQEIRKDGWARYGSHSLRVAGAMRPLKPASRKKRSKR
eukprot:s1062_g5.t1